MYNEGPSFQRWYLTDENIININNAGSFYIGAVFNAENEMTAIDFNYSSDGEVWQSLEPLKTYDYGFSWYSSYNEGYREARYNLSSLPDGDIWLQAVGHDVLGNSFQVNKKLYKDITRPADVTDFIVEVNEDKTALVLRLILPPTLIMWWSSGACMPITPSQPSHLMLPSKITSIIQLPRD